MVEIESDVFWWVGGPTWGAAEQRTSCDSLKEHRGGWGAEIATDNDAPEPQ